MLWDCISVPSIQQTSGENGRLLELITEKQQPADIIIADANPVYRENYDELNNDPSNKITAFNQDTLTVLRVLENTTQTRRNLVTALRDQISIE